MKAPVTLDGCGAFAVFGAETPITKRHGFRPSNHAKTGTVPVFRQGAGGGAFCPCEKPRGILAFPKFYFRGKLYRGAVSVR